MNPRAIFSAGGADHDHIFHRERRDGETVSGAIVGRGHVPHNVARVRIECNHVRVQRAQKNFVAENCRGSLACSPPNRSRSFATFRRTRRPLGSHLSERLSGKHPAGRRRYDRLPELQYLLCITMILRSRWKN
jgi:hypothetical protein